MERNVKQTSSCTHEAGSNERLIEIFEREIEREIAEKMVAVTEVSKNIRKCQQDLDRLRKEAVVKFYMDSKQMEGSGEQPSIHPAVQKLIGKRPVPSCATEQLMKNNMKEWRRDTRRKRRLSEHSHRNKQNTKMTKTCATDRDKETEVRPCYVPPVIPGNPQENSLVRKKDKTIHMRVLVGNVAKEVESEGEGSATHKWMVYVRSASGSLSLEDQITKVCFCLHPSYKPHDVITVLSPPYTLNRRGWGEFPLRVQLFFKNPLNKPADIVHNLKLNGARSGFHTRSAETFADLWVYPYQDIRKPQTSGESNSKEILWLASNMLKEEVPGFTTEVMCHRCLMTSSSSEVYKCTCDRIGQFEVVNCDTITDQTMIDTESSDSESSSNESESDMKYLGSLDPLKSAKDVKKECLTDQSLVLSNFEPVCTNSQKTNTIVDSTSLCLQDAMYLPDKSPENDTMMTVKSFSERDGIHVNEDIKTEVKIEFDSISKLQPTTYVYEQSFVTTNTSVEKNLETNIKMECESSSYLQNAKPPSEETLITPNISESKFQETKIKSEEDMSQSYLNGSCASLTKIGQNDYTQVECAGVPTYSNNQMTDTTEASNIKTEVLDDSFSNDIYLTNQFLVNQSDLLDLNVEPSDLFEELEIKEEIFDEIQKDINKELIEEKLLLDLVSENFIDWCSENPSIDSNKEEHIDHQINNEMKEEVKTEPASNCESSINKFIVNDSKSETNTFLACQTIAQENHLIEEIPINMFIDNIIEEEVVVDNESNSSEQINNASYLVEQKCNGSSVLANAFNSSNPNSSVAEIDLQSNNHNAMKTSISTHPPTDLQKLDCDIVDKEVLVDKSSMPEITNTSNFIGKKDTSNLLEDTGCKDVVSSPALSKCDVQNISLNTTNSTNLSKNLQKLNVLPNSKEPKILPKAKNNGYSSNENGKVKLVTCNNGIKTLLSTKSNTPPSIQSLVRKDNSCVLTTSNYNSKSILVSSKSSQSLLKPMVKNPNSLLKSNQNQPSNIISSTVQSPGISKALVRNPSTAQNIIVRQVISPSLQNNIPRNVSPRRVITPNIQSNSPRNIGPRQVIAPNIQSNSPRNIGPRQVVAPNIQSNSPRNIGPRQVVAPNIQSNSPRNVSPGVSSSVVKPTQTYLQTSNIKPCVQNQQNKSAKQLSIVSKHCSVRVAMPRVQHSIARPTTTLDTQKTFPKLNKLGLQSANVKVISTLRNVSGQIITPKLQGNSVSLPNSIVRPANPNTQNYNVRYTPPAPIFNATNSKSIIIKSTSTPVTNKTHVSQQKTSILNNVCSKDQKTYSILKANGTNPGEQTHKQTLLNNGIVNGNSKSVINQSVFCNKDDSKRNTNGLSNLKHPLVDRLSSRDLDQTPKIKGPYCREPNLSYKEIISINELRKVLRLPELHLSAELGESKTDCNNVLTCNSLHNDLKQAVPVYSEFNTKLAVFSNKDNVSSIANEQYLFHLHQLSWLVNSCKFSEPELAVRWLIRGMPLVHPDARLMSFKSVHPYCAVSADLYCSWPRAKQVANEWLRAKTIEKILKALKAKGVGLKHIWTTSTIYKWSEAHGYSPAIQPSGTDSDSSDNENIVRLLSKKTPPNNVMEWMESAVKKPKSEELIDVVGVDSKGSAGDVAVSRRLSAVDAPVDCGQGVICGKPWVRDMNRHVRKHVEGSLALEPLTPGDSLQPLAATVLSHLAVCFTEDLTRRALAVCYSRDGSSVLPCDVSQAILQRSEFDIFTQKGLQIDSKVTDFLKKYKSSHS